MVHSAVAGAADGAAAAAAAAAADAVAAPAAAAAAYLGFRTAYRSIILLDIYKHLANMLNLAGCPDGIQEYYFLHIYKHFANI